MRMPGATWIGPTGNENPGAMGDVRGLVLHIQQGTEAGSEAWERDPRSQVSSHFLLPKSGGVRQMVDTSDKAWCEVDGNAHWVSVECEGYSGQTLTTAQVLGAAQILAWLHQVYGVPLVPANDPGAASVAYGGLGYHSMGGAAWGGHYDCPGVPIIGQRLDICAQAARLVADQHGGEVTDMILVREADKPHVFLTNGTTRQWVTSEANLAIIQAALTGAGQASGVQVIPAGSAGVFGALVGQAPPA